MAKARKPSWMSEEDWQQSLATGNEVSSEKSKGFSKESQTKRDINSAMSQAVREQNIKNIANQKAQQNLSNFEAGGEHTNKIASFFGAAKEFAPVGEAAKEGSDAANVAGGMSASGAATLGKMGLEAATGETVGQTTGTGATGDGVVNGALTGASFGGAPGAVIGAVAGGVMGAAQERAATKARNAEIEAKKHAALGQIEEERGKNIASVLGNMGARMSAGFR